MKKVSIITRAYNRLEYTIQCINWVKQNTKYNNYEHIIINNNSNDGTKEWGNWIKANLEHWYDKVKFIHLKENTGDWGGMIKSLEFISKDSEYIVQLDNDIKVPKDWLNKMVTLLDNSDNKIIQLKRNAVRRNVKIDKQNTMYKNGYDIIYGNINRPVACFILKTKDFKDALLHINNKKGGIGKTQLSNFLGGTTKIINVMCEVIEGEKMNVGYINMNYQKYPQSNKNIYEKI